MRVEKTTKKTLREADTRIKSHPAQVIWECIPYLLSRQGITKCGDLTKSE